MFGAKAPSLVTEAGLVYVRKHVRDKYDPVVEEIDLLHANPNYAVVQSLEGREVTASARDIAPTPAGPGDAKDSQSLLQSNETPFSTLERTDSCSHDFPGTNNLDNQPDLQAPQTHRMQTHANTSKQLAV